MDTQKNINYNRIAEAITFIHDNFRAQPSLDEIAASVHLSPHHFQKMFLDWAGTTPKKFLQYISIQYAKSLLVDKRLPLFDAALETGFSSTSRLHDLFVNMEGMTPAEYKNGGADLSINYSFSESVFGNLIVASTLKGICYLAFEEDKETAFDNLRIKFSNANFVKKTDALQENAMRIFQNDWEKIGTIKLHLKGTEFQLKVWESLLNVPLGKLSTYGKIAQDIGIPKASRAVGTAIGSNPIAYLIPCHRVIQSSGLFGGYRWNPTRKTAMIGWEAAQVNDDL